VNPPIVFCTSTLITKLEKGSLHDSQLTTKRDTSLYDPITNNVCGVGSGHDMTTCLRATLYYSQW
jgi:hypothetical protein